MRIIKEAVERRNEILDRSIELFASKGYDHTSVIDIMKAVGIAKGTLYYHFKSKEDILDGIIKRIHCQVIENAKLIADDKSLGVNEKMLNTLMALKVKTSGSTEIFEEVHKPQNALMQQKMLHGMVSDISPILAKIISEGNEIGIFKCEYPHESAELFITYGNIIFDGAFMKIKEQEMMQKMVAFINNLEKVLGAKKDSMRYIFEMIGE